MTSDQINKGLQVIAAFALLVLCTVFICFTVAFVVEIELIASGCDRYLSLALAVLVGIGCNAFIAFNHKIRNFIKNRGVTDE
jgi:hypothetical protein